MNSATLLEMSAVEAVAAIENGSLTAERYAVALLEQCDRCAALNAFITLDRDHVLAAARAADRQQKSGVKLGPLHGLPIPIKDSVNTHHLRTTVGTPALRDFHPSQDAPIVRALREAGAIVLGKTNLHELSLGWTSNNLAFGAVRNPYAHARIPGGSSGGTAVAIAARMAPLGVAEDTEGSIRVPAALCGIAGFRPTTSRYPSTGVAPISPLFDQVGPHARTVADLALFDAVATGDFHPLYPSTLKGVKLGVGRRYWFAGLDSEVERITASALRKLHDAGVELVEADVPGLADLIQRTTLQVQAHDIFHAFPKYLAASGSSLTLERVVAASSPDVKAFFTQFGKSGKDFVPEDTYLAARDTYLPQLRQTFRNYFQRTGVAAIAFPATMVPATPIGQDEQVTIGSQQVPFETAFARNIAPGSTAGLPGLVLSAGLTQNGLPVSLEFDGPSATDRALLALGMSLERVLGHLPPPKV